MNPSDPPLSPALARFVQTIRSIRREAINQKTFGVPGCRFCRDVLLVSLFVDRLSCGPHQWTTELVKGVQVGKRKRHFLIVGYANPGTGVPNHLVSMFPVSAAPGQALVCLDPNAMTALSEGLYWENGELVDDWFRDKELLCGPLERRFDLPYIYSSPESPEHDRKGETETTELTLEGIPYRDSLRSLVKSWAESKIDLAEAIYR